MEVITISGKARSGKTTLGNYLKEYIEKQGKRAVVIQYGDFLKMICENYYGWERGDKSEKGRTLLQFVGTEIFREANPDVWVNIMIEILKGWKKTYDIAIIPDARFRNEIVKLRDCQDIDFIFTINVLRDGYENDLTEEQKNHASEHALDDWNFAITVKNDDTLEKYQEKVKTIWSYFNLSKGKEIVI